MLSIVPRPKEIVAQLSSACKGSPLNQGHTPKFIATTYMMLFKTYLAGDVVRVDGENARGLF